jgi:hypothetical protein
MFNKGRDSVAFRVPHALVDEDPNTMLWLSKGVVFSAERAFDPLGP